MEKPSYSLKTLEKADEIKNLSDLGRCLQEDLPTAPEDIAAELRHTIQSLTEFKEPVWGILPERHYVERILWHLKSRLKKC